MAYFRLCALLLCVLTVAHAEFDAEICTPVKESCGLLPPPLPVNFVMKGAHLNYKESSSYHEIYQDYHQQRAKYISVLNGIEKHYLYDYQVKQIIMYVIQHTGAKFKEDPTSHNCMVFELDESNWVYSFGFLDGNTGHPRMYNTYENLKFGGRHQYAYSGTEILEGRGLKVNKFKGCVYDQHFDATFDVDYSFTNSVFTAAGTTDSAVTGIEGDGPLSVPAHAHFFGAMHDAQRNEYIALNFTESTFWFSGEPDFEVDTFRIPPYVYCDGYRGRKEMPDLPTAYSVRVQNTTLGRSASGKIITQELTSFEQIMYSLDHKLMRRDFTPDEDDAIYSKFLTKSPVTAVYDFNTGLQFVTSRHSGRCLVSPMVPGSGPAREGMFIRMVTPGEMFHVLPNEMEYKGTDFTRDVECNVWTGKYTDRRDNITYVTEMHMLKNSSIPVKHTLISNLSNDSEERISTLQFYKFMAKPPPLRDFDVPHCIEYFEHKEFALKPSVIAPHRETLFYYKALFLETVQSYLTDITQVFTPLRIQGMELRQVSVSDTRILIMFTILGKANLDTKVPIGQPGASLDEAIVNLQNYILTNQFVLSFQPNTSTEPVVVEVLKGDLYVHNPNGDLEAPPESGKPRNADTPDLQDDEDLQDDILQEDLRDDVEMNNKKKQGWSSGALTGLSFAMLFIGIGIGIAIMYLYLRTVGDSMREDEIQLSEQPNENTGAAVMSSVLSA